MKIRLATEQDKVGVYETMGYCFNSDRGSIDNNIKNGTLNNHEQFIVAVNDKEEVISTFSVIPFNVNFEGEVVGYGGVGGVSSLPEHRGEGNIASMFVYALEYMKEHNMILSGLGPFAFQFYRKMGYEWCYTWQLVSVPINDLKAFPAAPKYKELRKENAQELEDFRNKVNSKINGPVVREAHTIDGKWSQYTNQRKRVYAALNENDEIVSAMVYHQEGREIKVSEIYFENETARQYLFNFLYRHRSMTDSVEFIVAVDDEIRMVLPTPRIKYWHWPYMMGRVVMVKEALKLLKLEENFKGSYTLKVKDDLANWNNKTFKISCLNKRLIVEETTKKADFEITIQRLSQLVFGYIGGKEALKLELLKVNNQTKEQSLIKSFSKRTTMLWQEF